MTTARAYRRHLGAVGGGDGENRTPPKPSLRVAGRRLQIQNVGVWSLPVAPSRSACLSAWLSGGAFCCGGSVALGIQDELVKATTGEEVAEAATEGVAADPDVFQL